MKNKLHEDDLNEVAGWIGAKSSNQIETRFVEMPLSVFMKQIKEMEDTYGEFPIDKKRTEEISKLLNKGECAQPIYIEDGDDALFVMEGRHRMVAFYWNNFDKVMVCFCKLKPA